MSQTSPAMEKRIVRQLRLEYLEYLPPAHQDGSTGETSQKWPLILFLHGAGERGDDLEKIKIHGLPKELQVRDLPFVVLSPQCPAQHWWSDFLPLLDDMIQSAIDQRNVDADRVYLTGLSMGGFGTWHMAVEYPQRFAAIAPICGSGPWMYNVRERLSDIRHLPTWVFHGARDEIVPPVESEVMTRSLQACGGNVRFTLYPEAGHDSWTPTYQGSTLYDWFLSHKRKNGQ